MNCTYKRHRTEPHEAFYGVFDVDDNLKGFVCQPALDEIQADIIGRVMKSRRVPDDGIRRQEPRDEQVSQRLVSS